MRFFIVLCGLLLVSVLIATNLSCMSGKTRKIDHYIAAHEGINQFSGAVLVAQKGKILLSKGYGMANYEWNNRITPNTKFRIASVTKQFTAMAILQLQEKGLLSVSDTLNQFIPDYPRGSEITLTHLLNHRSGIPNYTEIKDFGATEGRLSLTLEELIALFKDKPLNFTPGQKYEYSNSGYALLTYIIEKASGMPYEKYLQENIFQPLGMNHSGYDKNELIIKNRASGYTLESSGIRRNADYIDMSVPRGAGGLYSTIEDLYLWDRALYTNKLAPVSTLAATIGSLTKDPVKNEHAYGWILDDWFSHTLMWHNGSINGFSSSINRYINDDLCIIILSNLGKASPESMCADIARIVFGMPYELPKKRTAITLDPALYDAYVGNYEETPELIWSITKANDHLFFQATGQPVFEIFPESETKFFYKTIDAQISFIKDTSGNVTTLIFHYKGRDKTAKRLSDDKSS
jgi:CubicO group peptidase (beta-lactamase class C family)